MGIAAAFLWPLSSDWFLNLWCGAALATLPAFLLGLVVQAIVMPGSLGDDKVMVSQLGFIAAFLTAIGIAMLTPGSA